MESLGKEKIFSEARRKAEDPELPLISVCVVTYNHRLYLSDCLDGILKQEGDFRLEILIHDDASEDGARELIEDYERRFPEIIKPILQTENQYSKGKTNITGIFNIPRARGEFLAVMDGDDYYCDPRKLEKQIRCFQREEELVFCFHSAKVLLPDGSFGNSALMRPYRGSRILSGAELVDRRGGAPFASFLFRREILEALPDYYFDCPVGDRPLEWIAASCGKSFYLDEPLSVYRFQHSGSWTREQGEGEREKKQRRYREAMEKSFLEFDRESGGRFHPEIERAIGRLRFLSDVNLRDFPEIYRRGNREFYRELSLRDRFFLQFERRLPGLYRAMQKRFGQGIG